MDKMKEIVEKLNLWAYKYYTLDEDGLELIFATKEFYTEFSLSISQLILRKQLEKGVTLGAFGGR